MLIGMYQSSPNQPPNSSFAAPPTFETIPFPCISPNIYTKISSSLPRKISYLNNPPQKYQIMRCESLNTHKYPYILTQTSIFFRNKTQDMHQFPSMPTPQRTIPDFSTPQDSDIPRHSSHIVDRQESALPTGEIHL